MNKKLVALLAASLASNIAFAGGRNGESNLMDRYNETSPSTSSQTTQLFQTQSAAAPMAATASCDIDLDPTGTSFVFNETFDPRFETNFSFTRTLQNIIDSSPTAASQSTTPMELMSSLLLSYDRQDSFRDNRGVDMLVDGRIESDILSPTILTDMRPTGLFNRFDLTAADGSHCGEHRIVYHFEGASAGSRFLMIFEAQYPNPSPSKGLAGCVPVADFWASLDVAANAVELAEQFFYEGIVHNGVELAPVVQFNNYMAGSGQVRTNNFIESPWQLREFRTGTDSQGDTTFLMDTVKTNPLTELYGEFSNPQSPEALLAEAFKTEFLNIYIEELLKPELTGATDVINNLNMTVDDRFNEFQSTVSISDELRSHANSDFRAGIDNKIIELLGPDSGVSGINVLLRAESTTCHGCHQSTVDMPIAPGVVFPRSEGFVHIDERGNLSRALTNHFLPQRKAVLEDFLCNPPAGQGFTDLGAVGNDLYSEWAGAGTRIKTLDFNGDGLDDVLLGPSQSTGNWHILQSTGDSFLDLGPVLTNKYANWHVGGTRIKVIDFNADGRDDIILGPSFAYGRWYILRNDGGSFTDMGSVLNWEYGNWYTAGDRVKVIDYNNDGLQDIVLGPSRNSGNWYFIENTGGGFTDKGALITGKYGNWSAGGTRIKIIDYNADGKQDILLGPDTANGDWFALRNDGGTFTDVGAIISGKYAEWSGSGSNIKIIDFNNDGLEDILLGPSETTGEWFGLRNEGGTFTDLGSLISNKYNNWSGAGTRIKVMDFNGDSKQDILLGPSTDNGEWFVLEAE